MVIKFFFVHVANKVIVTQTGQNVLHDDVDGIINKEILQKAATILRKKILDIKPTKLPQNFTIENLKKGECVAPDELKEFYATLLRSSRRQDNNNCKVLIDSFSDDIIYAVSNGKIKPSKQITVGK